MEPTNTLTNVLERLAEAESLSIEESMTTFANVLDARATEIEIASLLTALRVRGETVEELVGAAKALRERLDVPKHRLSGLLDTCGTGGDGSCTFNISTATAIVVAACGVLVAKHGNRGISSVSGSADVLRELGVKVEIAPETVLACLRDLGIGFFYAPKWHPSLEVVRNVRHILKFRTIFNFLGPLANPVGAQYQLIGVARRDWAEKLAKASQVLGTKGAKVVVGAGGVDEVTLAGETFVVSVTPDGLATTTWTPSMFGLPSYPIEAIRVKSTAESAAMIKNVLNGGKGAPRDVVLANAAAALLTCQFVHDLKGGVARALDAIESGAARAKLAELIRKTNGLWEH